MLTLFRGRGGTLGHWFSRPFLYSLIHAHVCAHVKSFLENPRPGMPRVPLNTVNISRAVTQQRAAFWGVG
jgi:hypothetical protein